MSTSKAFSPTGRSDAEWRNLMKGLQAPRDAVIRAVFTDREWCDLINQVGHLSGYVGEPVMRVLRTRRVISQPRYIVLYLNHHDALVFWGVFGDPRAACKCGLCTLTGATAGYVLAMAERGLHRG